MTGPPNAKRRPGRGGAAASLSKQPCHDSAPPPSPQQLALPFHAPGRPGPGPDEDAPFDDIELALADLDALCRERGT